MRSSPWPAQLQVGEMLFLTVERVERNQGFLGTEKFHLMQGVLSHMAGKEVEREGETDASRL